MNEVVFAALSSLSFAFSSVVSRRAVIKVVDAGIGVLITIPLSALLFLLILVIQGRVGSIAGFSKESYFWFAAAGLIHFVVGRSLNYHLVQLVGANIGSVLRRGSPLVAVTLGITLLDELISWELIVGVILIVFGITVTSLNPQMFKDGQKLFSSLPRKAYLLGIGVGLSWGISPIFVKLGLQSSGSPVAGAFISYLAATIILSGSLLSQRKRASLISTKNSGALWFFCLAGICSSTAHLVRYIALSMGPASVVSPLVSTSPILTILLSFVFNRRLEVFSITVLLGIITAVAGSILLI